MNNFIKLNKVMVKTSLSRSSIYVGMAKGTFPQSIKLSERAMAWVESDIDAWIDSRIALAKAGA